VGGRGSSTPCPPGPRPGPTAMTARVDRLPGLGRVVFFADDMAAAEQSYSELGMEPYLEWFGPDGSLAYMGLRVGDTRMSSASSTAGTRPTARRARSPAGRSSLRRSGRAWRARASRTPGHAADSRMPHVGTDLAQRLHEDPLPPSNCSSLDAVPGCAPLRVKPLGVGPGADLLIGEHHRQT
jgi:hypothetical protein